MVNNTITGNNYTGNIAGTNAGTINDSYVKGSNITGNTYVGGMMGASTAPVTLNNLYTIATIYGVSYVGGLVGFDSTDFTNTYSIF